MIYSGPYRPIKRLSHLSFKRKLHVGIVGSGPAGFYTAQHLLKHAEGDLKIDMFEKLPIPFGLARYGVAPDHPEVKNVTQKFTAIAQDSRFRFYGNCQIGLDISSETLRSFYNALVLCCGSSSEHSLGLPGENGVGNIFSSRKLVGWYNSSPEFSGLDLDLSQVKTVAIIGQGNVALDVARILSAPISHLEATDISEQALDVLRRSNVNRVHVVGRRGPLEVAFSTKELREFFQLDNVKVYTDKELLAAEIERNIAALAKDRARRRLLELLQKNALSVTDLKEHESHKCIILDFLKTPKQILSNSTDTKAMLTGIAFDLNKLEMDENGKKVARSTGESTNIRAELLISSIGFRNTPIDTSIPFDAKQGVVPNARGRVLRDKAHVLSGLYVAGWNKTGPRGTIASTLFDATETADMILEDAQKGNLPTVEAQSLNCILKSKGIDYTTFADWEKLDAFEKCIGQQRGKPREKVTSVAEMLKIIHNAHAFY